LTFKKSVWFPLGFTLSYLILASTVVRSPGGSNLFGTIAVVGLAFVSSLLVWVFYCLSFLLKLRHWSRILVLTGLLSPVVVAASFLLLSSSSSQNH
jgi:apolipoprotein N-acyltransferase